MGEQFRLSNKGIEQALEILESEGYLPEAVDEEFVNTTALKVACGKYIDASRAKGDARSEQETRDVTLIALFEAGLEARLRRLVN